MWRTRYECADGNQIQNRFPNVHTFLKAMLKKKN